MRLRILGPVEIRSHSENLVPARRKAKTLLGMLSLRANTAVPVGWIIDGLWGERPPPSAAVNLRSYVGDLRRVLGPAGDPATGPSISSGRGTYTLAAEPDGLDTLAFDALATEGHRRLTSGDHELAVERLTRAAGLWRGPVLDGVPVPDALQPLIRLLDERRVDVIEDCVQARLELGQHAELAVELRELTAQHELRERLWGQLMLALHRCGRQVEAVAAYRRLRHLLGEELGVEPSPALRRLHERILRADPQLQPRGRAVGGAEPASVPRQLPPDVSAFVGRAPQLELLDGLLDDAVRAGSQASGGAVVVSAVSGTAGVGKTALAVHWAHRAAPRFVDGCLYADLRGYGPEEPLAPTEVLAGFLRGLGVSGADVPHEPAELTARYRTLLAGRRVLVVLDNVRAAEQVRPLLPGSPGCLVLVTSRDDLSGLVARDGARRVELDLMTADEAVALLRGLVGARVDATPDAALALVERCARLPLALRIAADLANRRPATPLAELAAEIADRRHGLDALDAGGDARTAVRAVFDWSYQALDAAAARALRLLALHPGRDLDLTAAAALLDRDPDEARRLVEALLRAHLLQAAGAGRYAMHDLLRAYARDLDDVNTPDGRAAPGASDAPDSSDGLDAPDGLDALGGRRTALTRLFDHYARAAAAAERWQPLGRGRPAPVGQLVPELRDAAQATAWLDAERANLVAATAHCAEHGWPAHASELSQALRPYLDGMHRATALTVHGYALRAARQAGDRAGEGAALSNLGGVYEHLGNYPEAAAHLRLALVIRTEVGDRFGEARTANNLGIVYNRLGRYDEACDQFHRSMLVWLELGDRSGQAMVLTNLGFVHYRLARYPEGVDCHRRALELFRRAGDRTNEGTALGNIGTQYIRVGRHREAVEHLRLALAIARETGDRAGEGYAAGSLGAVHIALGEHRTAREHVDLALLVHREVGDRAGEAMVLTHLGDLQRRLGRCADALRTYQHAVELDRELGERVQETQALNGLATTLLAMHRPDQARPHFRTALATARETGDRYEQACALDGLGHAALDNTDPTTATDHWREALRLYAAIGVPEAATIRTRLATHHPAAPAAALG